MRFWFGSVFFALFTECLLLTAFPYYMQETAAMTPFYLFTDFATNVLSAPGGLLTYLAEGLCSCMAKPWLGASLLAALLILLAWLMGKLFHVCSSFRWICWLPSLAMLLNYTQLGYMLYVMKVPGIAFSMPLGFIVVVCLVGVYLLAENNNWAKWTWTVIVSIIGYYAIGAYAFLACAMAFVYEILLLLKDRRRATPIMLLALPLCCLFMPRLLYAFGFVIREIGTLYVLGLPDWLFEGDEKYLWYPFLFSSFILICLPVLSLLKPSSPSHPICGLTVKGCILILCGVYVYAHSYSDENYRCILRMKQSVEKNDWEEVLATARACKSVPTRLQVLYTRLALNELGRGGEEMFRYPDGDGAYVSPRFFQYLRLIGGRSLYYYNGLINYSYRWSMEDMVEYGIRPDYLKYMVKCSILNREPALAHKYLAMLQRAPFCNDFVKKYKAYADKLSMAESDPEMIAIIKLLNYADLLDGDKGLVEAYLLNRYAMMVGGTREMSELSLQACLIQKEIKGFWPRFYRLLPLFEGHVPTHYQEAALLFATLEQRDSDGLPIDQNVRERFQRLIAASEENSQKGDEYNKMSLRPDFGDTYWYYYFFVKGLKTN